MAKLGVLDVGEGLEGVWHWTTVAIDHLIVGSRILDGLTSIATQRRAAKVRS
jgi:hypothetical protein